MRCRVLEGQRDSSVITLVLTSVIYKRFSSSVGYFKRSVIYFKALISGPINSCRIIGQAIGLPTSDKALIPERSLLRGSRYRGFRSSDPVRT